MGSGFSLEKPNRNPVFKSPVDFLSWLQMVANLSFMTLFRLLYWLQEQLSFAVILGKHFEPPLSIISGYMTPSFHFNSSASPISAPVTRAPTQEVPQHWTGFKACFLHPCRKPHNAEKVSECLLS